MEWSLIFFLYIKALSDGMVIDFLLHIKALSDGMVINFFVTSRPSPMEWSLIFVTLIPSPMEWLSLVFTCHIMTLFTELVVRPV